MIELKMSCVSDRLLSVAMRQPTNLNKRPFEIMFWRTKVEYSCEWRLLLLCLATSSRSTSSGQNKNLFKVGVLLQPGLPRGWCRWPCLRVPGTWPGLYDNRIVDCTTCCSLAPGLQKNGEKLERERMRKWREIHSLYFLILSLFSPSLSISYIKICHILSQNVRYGTFVASVTKNLTWALWGNNSGSNSLRGSSASCAGLSSFSSKITPQKMIYF